MVLSLKKPIRSFNKIKSKEAIKHPNWNMGKKISMNSSNLMNKILELIEAYKLFLFDPNKYEIVNTSTVFNTCNSFF